MSYPQKLTVEAVSNLQSLVLDSRVSLQILSLTLDVNEIEITNPLIHLTIKNFVTFSGKFWQF